MASSRSKVIDVVAGILLLSGIIGLIGSVYLIGWGQEDVHARLERTVGVIIRLTGNTGLASVYREAGEKLWPVIAMVRGSPEQIRFWLIAELAWGGVVFVSAMGLLYRREWARRLTMLLAVVWVAKMGIQAMHAQATLNTFLAGGLLMADPPQFDRYAAALRIGLQVSARNLMIYAAMAAWLLAVLNTPQHAEEFRSRKNGSTAAG